MAEFVEPLSRSNDEWEALTQTVIDRSIQNLDELGAASVDYTLLSGYTVLGYLWARIASVAQRRIEAGGDDSDFHRTKLVTARFYFERILPRTAAHAAAARAGGDTLMALSEDAFTFEG